MTRTSYPSIHSLMLWFALVASFLLSAYYYTGFYASDDITYLGTIMSLARGEQTEAGLGGLRFPVLLPAALVFKLTGENFFLTIFSLVFYHPLLVFLVYLLAKRIHNENTGTLAAVIIAFCPLAYVYAGSLLPDVALACWIAFWCIIIVEPLRDKDFHTRSKQRQIGWFVLAGLVNGIAYSAKESGLIIAVPAGLAILLATPKLISRTTFLWGICYGMGLLTFFVGEFFVIKLLTGEFIYRLGIMNNSTWGPHLAAKIASQGRTPFERLSFAYGLVTTLTGNIAIIVMLASLAIYPFFSKKAFFIWFLFAWLLCYHTFGTTTFSEYIPPAIVRRYYVMVAPYAAIMISFALLLLARLFVRAVMFCARRSPAGIAAGTPVLLLALILPAWWGIVRAWHNSVEAGLIYRSTEVKAFTKAHRLVKKNYSQYPLVFSPYTSRRMWPIFKQQCMAPNIHHTHPRWQYCNSSDLPAPPYIYLRLNNDAYESRLVFAFDKNKFEKKQLQLIYPPASRFAELAALATTLFGLPDRKFAESTDLARAYRIEMVTKKEPADTIPQN